MIMINRFVFGTLTLKLIIFKRIINVPQNDYSHNLMNITLKHVLKNKILCVPFHSVTLQYIICQSKLSFSTWKKDN